ncbi:unnamed protein product [Lactuca virosa]|uniref:Uncharacterized protein n=1 Tax=Lactuca virosa TaxID=75947 RepID=A0AAU9P5T5_9ASTR|nr:unnamed protein product [Lactuca virosa]
MQAVIHVADKPKKGGNGSKKGEKKTAAKEGPSGATKPSPKNRKALAASSTSVLKRRKQPARKRKTPTPSTSEGSDSETESDVRIEQNQPVRNEEEEAIRNEEEEPVRNEEEEHVRNEEATTNQEPPVCNEEETTNPEVNQSVNDFVPSPPPSPKTSVFTSHVSSPISSIRNDDPDRIFRDDGDDDDLGGFTYSPFQIRTESEDEATVSKGQLKAIHKKLDQLLLASKASSSDVYSKATVESLFERITKEHAENVAKMNVVVSELHNNLEQ